MIYLIVGVGLGVLVAVGVIVACVLLLDPTFAPTYAGTPLVFHTYSDSGCTTTVATLLVAGNPFSSGACTEPILGSQAMRVAEVDGTQAQVNWFCTDPTCQGCGALQLLNFNACTLANYELRANATTGEPLPTYVIVTKN